VLINQPTENSIADTGRALLPGIGALAGATLLRSVPQDDPAT